MNSGQSFKGTDLFGPEQLIAHQVASSNSSEANQSGTSSENQPPAQSPAQFNRVAVKIRFNKAVNGASIQQKDGTIHFTAEALNAEGIAIPDLELPIQAIALYNGITLTGNPSIARSDKQGKYNFSGLRLSESAINLIQISAAGLPAEKSEEFTFIGPSESIAVRTPASGKTYKDTDGAIALEGSCTVDRAVVEVRVDGILYNTTYCLRKSWTISVGFASRAAGNREVTVRLKDINASNEVSWKFTIEPTAKATRLGFANTIETQYGENLLEKVKVIVYDQNGKVFLGQSPSVRMRVAAGPSTSMFFGLTSVKPVDGVADFSGLVMLWENGSGYQLVAEADGLESAKSSTFTVKPVPYGKPKLTLVDVIIVCRKRDDCPTTPKDWVGGWTYENIQRTLLTVSNPYLQNGSERLAALMLDQIKFQNWPEHFNHIYADWNKLEELARPLFRSGHYTIVIVNSIDEAGGYADLNKFLQTKPRMVASAYLFGAPLLSISSRSIPHEFGHTMGFRHLSDNSTAPYEAVYTDCGENIRWTVLNRSKTPVCTEGKCYCDRNHVMSYAALEQAAFDACKRQSFFIEFKMTGFPDMREASPRIMRCWNKLSHF